MRTFLVAALALLAGAGPARAADMPLPDRTLVHTRAVTLSLGGAVGAGAIHRDNAFEPGLDPSWTVTGSGSPAVAMGWEAGAPSARFFADLTAYPTYVYWVGSDVMSLDLVHLTAGALFGSDKVRVGPEVFGGLLAAGGGVRAVVTPWTGAHGRRHGLDLRADVLLAGGPTGRLAVMYTFTPWRRFGGAAADG